MKNKELEKISNNGEIIYELKQEYLDDLTKKLNDQRPPKKKGVYRYLVLLCLLIIGGVYMLYPNEELVEIDKNTSQAEEKLGEKIWDENPLKRDVNGANGSLKVKENDLKNKSIEEGNLLVNNNLGSIKKSAELRNKSNKKDKNTSPNNSNDNRKPNLIVIQTSEEGNKQIITSEVKGVTSQEKTSSMETTTSQQNKANGKGLIADKKLPENTVIKQVYKTSTKENESEKKPSDLVNNHLEELKKGGEIKLENGGKTETKDSLKTENKTITEEIESKETGIIDSVKTTDSVSGIGQMDSGKNWIDSNEVPSNWHISLLSGANVSFVRLTNSVNQTYFTKRMENENQLVSFTGGIMLERVIDDKFKLGTGITYISYGSKNNYTATTVFDDFQQFNGFDSVFSPTIDSIYFQPTSSWLPYLVSMDTTLDSAFVAQQMAREDSTALKSSGKVSFSYVELPLLIGYYKTINKWSFGINTGVSVGLLTRNSGSFIHPDLVSVQAAKSQQIIWNYLLSPEINFHWNEKLYIGFQPMYRLGLNNLSIAEPLERTYQSIQFNAKIGMKF